MGECFIFGWGLVEGAGGAKIMCWCQIGNLLISNPLCISVQLLVRDPNELLGSEFLFVIGLFTKQLFHTVMNGSH